MNVSFLTVSTMGEAYVKIAGRRDCTIGSIDTALVILFELEGESCPALADAFDVPVGTVYSRLHAARRAFEQAVRELREGR